MSNSSGTKWYWFVVGFVRKVIFPLLGGITVIGKENIPAEGSLLITPIHLSHIDPPLVGCTSTRALRFMAKRELFTFWLGPLIRSLGSFPVSRGENDSAAIRLAIQELKSGNALILFPEGTRGDAIKLQQLESGVTMLAKRSGATVVPVGISGSEKLLPKGKIFPKRNHVTIVYGRPFTYQELAESGLPDREVRELFLAELSSRIVEACHQAGLALKPN